MKGRAPLIAGLYLADEILSSRLPVSSGIFALACATLVLTSPIPSLRVSSAVRIGALMLMLLLTGAAGALLSGTPLSAFFLMTLFLMGLLWVAGARLAPVQTLLTPAAAAGATALVCLAMALSGAGFDLYALTTGKTTTRGAGWFAEPSHLALYVVPLLTVAWAERRYRPGLLLAWMFLVFTAFSLTLLLATLLAGWVVSFVRPASEGKRAWLGRAGSLLLIALLTAGVMSLTIDGAPASDYVSSRLTSFAATGGDDANPNISSLVVLQGLALAADSFRASYGLGVGLGNLGLAPGLIADNEFRYLINEITADSLDLNLRDGAILLNKLVGEVGVFGALLIVALVVSIRRMRRLPPPYSHYHAAALAALLSVVFVRALPYFSAPGCLAILTIASLMATRPLGKHWLTPPDVSKPPLSSGSPT